jgi:sterol desaturase/sphingolipid hydroxylase (fatty acid hydroxylase superfamily)
VNLLPIAVLFVAGLASWSLAEYLLHRFLMHSLRGRGKASREHLRHHAGVEQAANTTALSWLGIFVVGAVVFFPAGWLLAGVAGGAAMAVGWVVGYSIYEYLHWAAHQRAPRTRYERWLRHHHFHHHFGAPLKNHGVTSPVWDLVFGTFEAPGRIRVPRRMAMVWLVDATGTVHPAFDDHYEVVGRANRDAAREARDADEAFANLAPSL